MTESQLKFAQSEYEKWERTFDVKNLYNIFEGVVSDENTYHFNLFGATVEEKMSNLTVPNPGFTVSLLPGAETFNFSEAAMTAARKEALLNSLIARNPEFVTEAEAAIQDSFFGFGVLVTEYDEDLNPSRPASMEMADPEYSDEDSKLEKSFKKSLKEASDPTRAIYFQRIKFWRFRVSDCRSEDPSKCAWCGYYIYRNENQIEALKWKWPEEKERYESRTKITLGNETQYASNGYKLWVIWDNVRKMKGVYWPDGTLASQEWSFQRLPLQFIRWRKRSRGFYPIPPTFSWVTPQAEVNDTRNTMRDIRLAAVPHLTVLNDGADPSELDKLTSGTGPQIIRIKRAGAIEPLKSVQIPQAVKDSFVQGVNEFNIVAATTPERQGIGDRATATQVNAIEAQINRRESKTQEVIANFYCAAAKEALLLSITYIDTELLIPMTGIPGDTIMSMTRDMMQSFTSLAPSSLNDGHDFIVRLNPAKGSPMIQQQRMQSFLSFLALISQYPYLTYDPDLIVEAAVSVGYTNYGVIARMQQAAIMNQILQKIGGDGGASGASGATSNSAKEQIAQNSPSNTEQTRAQLDKQMGRNQ